jgi:uncharacterized protein (DUF2164 family)
MAIELTKETKEKAAASIMRYFREELDEDIGDLKASLVLDFILREIGPVVYNQAVSDAQALMRNHVAELEDVVHEKEFAYWAKKR